MIFILSIITTIAAFIVWRSASSKMRQDNTAVNPIATVSALVAGVFSVLALLQCLAL
jgi:hypothetical protein